MRKDRVQLSFQLLEVVVVAQEQEGQVAQFGNSDSALSN